MNQSSRQSLKSQSSAVSSSTKENQRQSPNLPAPVLEHRNLSVLERCVALRTVYGRGCA